MVINDILCSLRDKGLIHPVTAFFVLENLLEHGGIVDLLPRFQDYCTSLILEWFSRQTTQSSTAILDWDGLGDDIDVDAACFLIEIFVHYSREQYHIRQHSPLLHWLEGRSIFVCPPFFIVSHPSYH